MSNCEEIAQVAPACSTPPCLLYSLAACSTLPCLLYSPLPALLPPACSTPPPPACGTPLLPALLPPACCFPSTCSSPPCSAHRLRWVPSLTHLCTVVEDTARPYSQIRFFHIEINKTRTNKMQQIKIPN